MIRPAPGSTRLSIASVSLHTYISSLVWEYEDCSFLVWRPPCLAATYKQQPSLLRSHAPKLSRDYSACAKRLQATVIRKQHTPLNLAIFPDSRRHLHFHLWPHDLPIILSPDQPLERHVQCYNLPSVWVMFYVFLFLSVSVWLSCFQLPRFSKVSYQ